MDNLSILSNLWDDEIDSVDCDTLRKSLNRVHRSAVLKWLFESLELLHIEDRVFFTTAMLADRFCAHAVSNNRPLEGSELQLVILASLCCSLKTVECTLDLPIREFLEHVSGGHVEPRTIFQKETEILQALNWNVITQSLCVFIDSFYYALTFNSTTSPTLEQACVQSPMPQWALKQSNLARFLLFLSVFDTDWLHSRKPSVLAAACILTSAYTLLEHEHNISMDNVGTILIHSKWIEKDDDLDFLVAETIHYWHRSLSNDAIAGILALYQTSEKNNVAQIRPPRLISRLSSSGA